MTLSQYEYGVCGVYCGQCPNGNGRVRYAAGELKRLVDTTRYGWVEEAIKSFSFNEFRRASSGSARHSAGAAAAETANPARTGSAPKRRGSRAA